MASPRPFQLVRTLDQWLRCAHEHSAIDADTGGVQLAWDDPVAAEAEVPGVAAAPVGLAFDRRCRLYRTVAAAGQVERWPWTPDYSPRRAATPTELFARPTVEPAGDFVSTGPERGALAEPSAVAATDDDVLWVGDAGPGTVFAVDLAMRRVDRAVPLADVLGPGYRPVDLVAHGDTVWLLAAGPEAALLRFAGRRGPWRVELPSGLLSPSRLAVAPDSGRLLVLDGANTAAARVVAVDGSIAELAVAFASDLELPSEDLLVVARRPGDDFLRLRRRGDRVVRDRPLEARGYDGAGIVATPDGRIAYFAGDELRHAVVARRRHRRRGQVTSFRLDAGAYQARWGRLLLDACIPAGSAVRVYCAAADEPEGPAIPWAPAAGVDDPVPRRPELSPPALPEELAPGRGPGRWQALHRRGTGSEQPWVVETGGFETYEAPIDSPPGRYLWVVLELSGNVRTTPRIRGLRAETAAHDWLERLPAALSRDPDAADFLHRYLGMLESVLGDLEGKVARRALLVDAEAAPEELLPWLAGLVGLVLDDRWPVASRRKLVAEAAELFRMRGTVAGLSRFLELYLERPVRLLEHFRFRSVSSVLTGDGPALDTAAVVGTGLRVGGTLGRDRDAAPASADAFARHAHRFTVLVHGILDDEQVAVVEHILELHRPAHTVFDLCTVGAGMRVGRGLHVGLSSVVGPTGGFARVTLGTTPLGPVATLGRPAFRDHRLGRETRLR